MLNEYTKETRADDEIFSYEFGLVFWALNS